MDGRHGRQYNPVVMNQETLMGIRLTEDDLKKMQPITKEEWLAFTSSLPETTIHLEGKFCPCVEEDCENCPLEDEDG